MYTSLAQAHSLLALLKMSLMAKPLVQSPIHTSLSMPYSLPPPQFFMPSTIPANQPKIGHGGTLILRRSDFSTAAASGSSAPSTGPAPPVIRKRTRYRKQYPGENVGITEEMRFVAMRLRNINGKKYTKNDDDSDDGNDDNEDSTPSRGTSESESDGDELDTWQPSMEGFLQYLVDTQLVFNTVERIVDESNDVACEFCAIICNCVPAFFFPFFIGIYWFWGLWVLTL